MSISLFRPEVSRRNSARLLGETTLALPVSYLMMTGFLTFVVAAVLVFLSLGTYARHEHVGGFLVSTVGIATIMPPRPGVITAVHVSEGQLVRRGDPLLTVSAEQTTDGGEGASQSKLQSLGDERARLTDQIAAQRRRAELTDARLRDAIADLAMELAAMQKARDTQASRVEIARQEMMAIMEPVAKGFVSELEYRQRRDNYFAQQQSQQTLAGQVAAKQSELEQRRHDLQQLPTDTAAEIARLRASIADIDVKMIDIDAHRAYVLTAPVPGRVSALQAWVGRTAEPNIPQLSIVPEGASLQAELLVPARAIGFVAPGQPVRIGYDTFPYQQFGLATGAVRTVSYTLLKPDEVVGPVLVKEPSYRVGVILQRQSIKAYGKETALQPDMQLSADILFDSRSLLAWLLDPLFAALRSVH
jgi:membrane fusion protein